MIDVAVTRDAVSRLVGMPLTAARRQGSMLALTFGELREAPAVIPRPGRTTRIVGDYFVDVQCSWRLVQAERGIIMGADDQFVPAGQPKAVPNGLHYDGPEGNHLDEQIASWRTALPLMVSAVDTDPFGGLVVSLSEGYQLQVFPSHHHGDEYWRLFTAEVGGKHFVVTGRGIDPDDD